jgi:hypothetical protein
MLIAHARLSPRHGAHGVSFTGPVALVCPAGADSHSCASQARDSCAAKRRQRRQRLPSQPHRQLPKRPRLQFRPMVAGSVLGRDGATLVIYQPQIAAGRADA